MKHAVKTDKAPKALGPYSAACLADNDMLFLSGQLGINPETNELAEGFENQCRQSLENVKNILNAAYYDMNDVIKTTIFLSDINNFAKFNEIYGTYFTEPYPARSAIQVAALPKGALIEIEAIAFKTNGCILEKEAQK